MSTTRALVIAGESASGAVGSSTTISISELDIAHFVVISDAVWSSGCKNDRHHPPPNPAFNEPGDELRRMVRYPISPVIVIAKVGRTGCPTLACHRARRRRDPLAGHDASTCLLRDKPRLRHQRLVE